MVSDSYFDKYQFESDPALLFDIANELNKLIPRNTEVLAGLEMGGIPIVTMLSNISRLHCAFVRKKPKEHGTCRYSEGADLFNKNVLIVEDVVSSGGQIIESVTMLRDDRINISQALCVIDRETGGCEKLKEAGIELISLFKQSELDAITSRT
jgi:orotate phosphoribosyltransferase